MTNANRLKKLTIKFITMKNILSLLLMAVITFGCSNTAKNTKAPAGMEVADHWKHAYLGSFVDDYGIKYEVKNDLWVQEANIKYHIVEWNEKGKYLIAKNGAENPSEKNLYTRIDFTNFENMADFKWGFCLTKYDAISIAEAKNWAAADKVNAKTGCNGFPFSRMKRIIP